VPSATGDTARGSVRSLAPPIQSEALALRTTARGGWPPGLPLLPPPCPARGTFAGSMRFWTGLLALATHKSY